MSQFVSNGIIDYHLRRFIRKSDIYFSDTNIMTFIEFNELDLDNYYGVFVFTYYLSINLFSYFNH